MLAARVEPKNAPQESEKTDNFKLLVFRQFQPGVDMCQPRFEFALKPAV